MVLTGNAILTVIFALGATICTFYMLFRITKEIIGEHVSLWCAPPAGSGSDPRINLLGPSGEVVASDDDGGDGRAASLSSVRPSSSGTYTIQVDM